MNDNEPNQKVSKLNLPNLGLSLRILFTGYLLVTSVGLLSAGLQLLLTHGMADGQFGLSVDDIVYSYYGNRENSKLEIKLNGSMKDKADVHERAEIIRWVRTGSPEDVWTQKIQPIVMEKCARCHGGIAGLPDFTTYEGIKTVAKIDEGASIGDLARVSHIHLFGISFIFFFICLIFSLASGINPILKAVAIGTPFVFLLVDIFSWWLTKWYPAFAYTTIIGATCYNTAATYMILTSLYQMWILPRRRHEHRRNTWFEE
jgi:hypothetical protein